MLWCTFVQIPNDIWGFACIMQASPLLVEAQTGRLLPCSLWLPCHCCLAIAAAAAAAAAASGKEAAEGAAAVFQDMASQSGLVLQPIPVVDGQLDL